MGDRSFRDVRQAHQSTASAHDRRHDSAPDQGEGAERLRPARQDLRGLSRPFAGHRHERGPSPLYRGTDLVVIPQPDGTVACIPAWMTHESAAHHKVSIEPNLSLDVLRALRA